MAGGMFCRLLQEAKPSTFKMSCTGFVEHVVYARLWYCKYLPSWLCSADPQNTSLQASTISRSWFWKWFGPAHMAMLAGENDYITSCHFPDLGAHPYLLYNESISIRLAIFKNAGPMYSILVIKCRKMWLTLFISIAPNGSLFIMFFIWVDQLCI